MFNEIYSLFYDEEMYAISAIALFNLLLLAAAVAITAWGLGVLLNRIQHKNADDRTNPKVNFWMAALIALVGGYIGFVGGGSETSLLVLAIIPAINFLGVAAIVYLHTYHKPLGGLPVYLFAFVIAVIFSTFAGAYVRDTYRKPRIVYTEICTAISSNLHEFADEDARKQVLRIFEETCSAAIGAKIKLSSEDAGNEDS